MKLPQAILNVLALSPRAINAAVIAGMAGAFTGDTHTIRDVELALVVLERDGLVAGTESRFAGKVWIATAEGRLEA